jgi:hypothetical protein
MAGVKTKLDIAVAVDQTGSGDLGTPSFSAAARKTLRFVEGTAATNETDVLFSDGRTLAASASEDLDLRGTLTDAFGAVVNFAEIVMIYVEALDTNTNNVVIGGAASNQFIGPFGAGTHTIALAPGDVFCITNKAGWAVTAGTGDLLKIANSGAGTSVKYNIVLVGRTAAV